MDATNDKPHTADATTPALDATERERLAALAEAATPGPWGYLFAGKNRFTTPVDIDVTEADWGGENLREYSLSCSDDRNAWRAADVEFIAAARDAVPALLAALAEAEATNERLGAMVEWLCEVIVDAREACQRAEQIQPMGSPDWVESGIAMRKTALREVRMVLDRERTAHPSALDRVANERDRYRRQVEAVRHICATVEDNDYATAVARQIERALDGAES